MRSLVLLSLLFVHLSASVDSDMDGVDNDMDRCPNTPFFELVDKTGCTTDKIALKAEHHYDIMLGAAYVKMNNGETDTLVSFVADYYYENFIFTLFTQPYSQNNTYDGTDIYLSVNYKVIMDNFTIKFGPGMVLPIDADSSNETDYFLNVNLNYKIDKFDLNLYYKYTYMNDALTQNIDTKAVSIGYYLFDTTYINLSYSTEKSIYKGIENVENTALVLNHAITEHWFTNLRFTYGLSDSANDLSTTVNLGYYF
jgi:hypothetical protein